jgi:hypothetical protein
MGKAPAFQFYVRDWLSDPQLRQASPASRGIWIDMLCFMWESETRGELSGTVQSLARMLGVSEVELDAFCHEAVTLKFATVTERNKIITVVNRRMKRESDVKESNKIRQRRHRERACNAQNNGQYNEIITAHSSSSSSPSRKNTKEIPAASPDPNPVTTPTVAPDGASSDDEDFFKPEPKKPGIRFDKKPDLKIYLDGIMAKCLTLEKLPCQNGKRFNPFAWVQEAVNHHAHPQAIMDSLDGLILLWADIKEPWGYGLKILKTKSGNYHESDHQAQAQAFKGMVVRGDLKKLLEGIG